MPHKDPEVRRAYMKNWRNSNRHRFYAYHRRYYDKPATKILRRGYEATRRASKLSKAVESVDALVVYCMHGGCCGICKQFVAQNDFHVDHVIPLSKGGVHSYANCQPAHPLCNTRKGNRV